MSVSRQNENRLFSTEERALVDRTRGPALAALTDDALVETLKLLRERQSRARTIANRQRREMRGKSGPSGTTPARRNDGSERKGEALTAAVKRLNNERQRRLAAVSKPSQAALARKALRLKKSTEGRSTVPTYRTAGQGMRNNENKKFDDLSRPMEIGRVNKAVAVAQAKRDAR